MFIPKFSVSHNTESSYLGGGSFPSVCMASTGQLFAHLRHLYILDFYRIRFYGSWGEYGSESHLRPIFSGWNEIVLSKMA